MSGNFDPSTYTLRSFSMNTIQWEMQVVMQNTSTLPSEVSQKSLLEGVLDLDGTIIFRIGPSRGISTKFVSFRPRYSA